MDSFRFGCQSLMDILPVMMIRRLDLALFATSHDIEDKSKIYIPRRYRKEPRYVTPDNLRALIYFAWNLRPDQILIPEDIAGLIRERSLELSRKFGGCADLPIVYSEDFRKNFCRLVVALAVFDLSTDKDFKTVTV